MSTTPSSPPPEQPQRGYGYTAGAGNPLAGMAVPFNSELVLYLLVEALFAILWAATDPINSAVFASLTAAVTVGYLISRGIAKASRVLEH
jgi:hypothetical protein